MASPITTWEGAEAVFTFANNPTMIGIILFLSMAATLFAIIATIIHENHSYIDYNE